MLRSSVVNPDQSYVFPDYFKLDFSPQEVLAYFGVSFLWRSLKLPRDLGPRDCPDDLLLYDCG